MSASGRALVAIARVNRYTPFTLLEIIVIELHVAQFGPHVLLRRAQRLQLALHVSHGVGVVAEGTRVLGL